MFARLIRLAILESPRYRSLTLLQQSIFFHLLLLADDYGCLALDPDFIRRRACLARGMARKGNASDAALDAVVDALNVAGVLELYECDGARYGRIPRYRQNLRRMHLKHPAPPPELYANDPDARKLFARLPMGARVGTMPTHKQQEITLVVPRKQAELPIRALAEVKAAEPAAPAAAVPMKTYRVQRRAGESDESFAERVLDAKRRREAKRARVYGSG